MVLSDSRIFKPQALHMQLSMGLDLVPLVMSSQATRLLSWHGEDHHTKAWHWISIQLTGVGSEKNSCNGSMSLWVQTKSLNQSRYIGSLTPSRDQFIHIARCVLKPRSKRLKLWAKWLIQTLELSPSRYTNSEWTTMVYQEALWIFLFPDGAGTITSLLGGNHRKPSLLEPT